VSELNPNHPVTRTVHELWHKICALLLLKFGEPHVVITLNDMMRLNDDDIAITIQEFGDGIHIRLVSMADGERLARKDGGLPV
jgi:hypothetical protein